MADIRAEMQKLPFHTPALLQAVQYKWSFDFVLVRIIATINVINTRQVNFSSLGSFTSGVGVMSLVQSHRREVDTRTGNGTTRLAPS